MIVARKPDFAAVPRTPDISKSRVLGQFVVCFLNVLSHARLPNEGSRMDDPNQNTHLRMSAHHEDPSKTNNRSRKEQ